MTRIIHKSTDKLISVKVWLSGICSQHLELSVIANVRLLLVTHEEEWTLIPSFPNYYPERQKMICNIVLIQ